jgi:undecaprenyl-diphosphatase
VTVREAWRLSKTPAAARELHAGRLWTVLTPSLLGMVFSFVAGLMTLRWLSRWLEQDRWHSFGCFGLFASLAVYLLG